MYNMYIPWQRAWLKSRIPGFGRSVLLYLFVIIIIYSSWIISWILIWDGKEHMRILTPPHARSWITAKAVSRELSNNVGNIHFLCYPASASSCRKGAKRNSSYLTTNGLRTASLSFSALWKQCVAVVSFVADYSLASFLLHNAVP